MAQTPSTSSLTPQSFYQSTLSGNITAADTTIPITSLPTANEGYLVLESTSSTAREIIHYTSKTGSAVVCGAVGDRGLFGTTAQAHSQGALVEDNWVTGYWLDLQSMVATASAATLQRHLANPNEGQFGNNFVTSGYGLTGASSSLVATLASGIAYVAGSRVLAAVGGHTYPANSDIFVDVNSSGSLTFVGSGSSNLSGASVPLTANSIRLARVNTHATGINAITQDGSSDLGGSVVKPHPSQVLLGSSVDVVANQAISSIGSNVALTGFSVPVTIPANGASVEVVATIPELTCTGATIVTVALWDGAVGGTQLTSIITKLQDSGDGKPVNIYYKHKNPASGPKTYSLSLSTNTNNTTANMSATSPGQMVVKAI